MHLLVSTTFQGNTCVILFQVSLLAFENARYLLTQWLNEGFYHLPVQVRVAVSAFGRGLPWDLHKVEKKLHLLFREWDASHPRPVHISFCLLDSVEVQTNVGRDKLPSNTLLLSYLHKGDFHSSWHLKALFMASKIVPPSKVLTCVFKPARTCAGG